MGYEYKLKRPYKDYEIGSIFYRRADGSMDSARSCVYGCAADTIPPETFANFPGLLEAWFEGIPEEPKTVWDLKEGDKCFILQSGVNGILYAAEISWNGRCEGDRAIGDVFLTEKEAEKELTRRRAKQILLRDTKGFKPDWYDPAQAKWSVSYDVSDDVFEVDFMGPYDVHCAIYFATERDALNSTSAHKKEWKIYLGVEDEEF